MLDRIRSGDDEIFRKIYGEYRQSFIGWIYQKYGSQEDDAIEIFQQAIVIMYDNVVTGKLTELTSSLKTYLFAIGRNLALEKIRKDGKKASLPDIIKQHIEDDGIVKDEMFEKAQKALEKLGEPCKGMIEQSFYNRLSSDELAILFGYKNADTAKSKKHKCLKKLRDILNNDDSTPNDD